jgi:hypothetical protein
MIIAAMAVDARYTALVTTDKRVLPSGRTRSVYAAAGVFGPTPDADAAAFKATFGWGWGTITDMVDALRCAAYFASARADLIREADDTAFTPTAKSLIARARRMMADADPERGAKRIEARNKAVIDAETAKRDADALNKARPDVYAAIMATDEPIAVDNASGKVITAVGTVNEDALRGLRVMHAAGNVAGIAELIRLAQYAIANPWKPTVREEDAPTDDAATADAASANEADAAATPEEDAAPIVKAKRTRKPRAAA